MSASTNNPTSNANTHSSGAGGIGTKVKGGIKVAQGVGNTVRGTTFGAIDTVEHRDSHINDEIARRGRMEIEEGIAMIKGRPVQPGTAAATATTGAGPGNSLQGWGGGINGANPEVATNSTGFPPPRGQEYVQNSTTAAHPAHTTEPQPPVYPNGGAAAAGVPYPQDKAPGGIL
ncbi:hypothetical protein MKEN_00463800 [Mycena kentingensis (nom. inval.)]|nr:hypothetical protein MKEN_00463800 [Mycena kentingensis (nom. inval.)]